MRRRRHRRAHAVDTIARLRLDSLSLRVGDGRYSRDVSKGKRNREERRRASVARRHHLVSRFYLNRFADDHERLAAIRGGTGATHVASTEKLCAQVDFYSYIDVEGEKSGELEMFLAKFESEAAPAFERIASAPTATPSEDDRALILNFIAFQVGRGRYFRHQYNALADFGYKLMLSFESKDRDEARERLRYLTGRDPDDEELAVWLETLEKPDDYVIEPHSNESLMAGLQVGAEMLDSLAARPWIVLRMGEPILITSDEPVTLWNRQRPEDAFYGRGIANSDEVRLPLDQHHMLVLTLEEPPKRKGAVPPLFARDMNRLTASSANEWVFAHPSNADLSVVAQWAGEAPPRALRANVFGEEKTIEPRPPLSRSLAVRPKQAGS